MKILDSFYIQIESIFSNGVFGISLFNLAIIISCLIFALFIRGVVAKLVVSRVKRIFQKTTNDIDDNLFEALGPPFKLLPIVLVFLGITLYFDIDSTLGLYFQKINNTLSTVFIFWLIHQSLIPFSNFFSKLETVLTKALVLWITRSLKYLII